MLRLINYVTLISLAMSLMLMFWTIMIKKVKLNRDKNSPFECGFQPLESPRLPISIHFFLLGIMFLIFDIEVVLIMPLIIVMNIIKTKTLLITSLWLMIILLWGLYNEWNYQSLNWT